MAGNEYFPTRPHTEQNRAIIAAGSPMALVGLFLESIRSRFAEGNGLPGLVWRDDVQTTDILIEAGYNTETESRDYGRAVYVNRLNTSPSKLVLGNRGGVHLPDHMEGFICMMASNFSIDCVSNDAGESARIADIVQSFLIAGGKIIEGWYGIHDCSLADMGQTMPFTHDQDKWSTPVSLQVQYQARWSTVKIRPLLQDIGVRVRDGGASVAAYHESLASVSLARSTEGYTHLQRTADTTWTIEHGLGFFPRIVAVDSQGYALQISTLLHASPTQAVLTFTTPVAGSARAV